jgi:colanic acid/amylovoran biosynthesis glycosyltransferase
MEHDAKQMKILMYSDMFGGATTTFIQNDLAELSKIYTVKYLSTGQSTTGQSEYKDLEIVPFRENPMTRKIHWILEKRGLFLTFVNSDFSRKVNQIINDFKPDIIQCNFGYEALRLTDNLYGENRKIPLVINFLGYDASFHLERSSYVRKLIALTKLSNVYATCNTGFLKNNLERKNIFFLENRIIHTGVRTDYFNREGLYPQHPEFIFLQIATLSERKGQEITIRAFKEFLDHHAGGRSCKLILAGGAEDQKDEAIRSLPRALGIADFVEFIGWISIPEAKALLLQANCYVHHSRTVEGRTEGIPTIISEAMSLELPVISTWHAGIPELVEDGLNGYLVRENDIQAYAKRMKDSLTFGFQKRNREKVIGKFNIHNRTKAFTEFYSAILHR